jgi:hypothetical protein
MTSKHFLTRKTRHLALLMVSILLVVISPPKTFASTEVETEIPGYVALSYSTEISLKKSGCQKIKFNYVVDESLPLENTAWLVQIIHFSKKKLYGEIAWFSEMTYRGDDALPSLPRAGKRDAKICRNSWTYKPEDNSRKFHGVIPGKYRLYFAGVTLDPITGELLGQKTEFFKSILFK